MFSANGIAVFCMAVFILCAVRCALLRCCAVAVFIFYAQHEKESGCKRKEFIWNKQIAEKIFLCRQLNAPSPQAK